MRLVEALTFLRKNFSPHSFTDTAYEKFSSEVFLDVLDSVENEIPFRDGKQNEALGRFLWAGCRKFNRWFVPTPYVVPRDQHESHARFVQALLKADRGVPENASVFQVHVIRDHLYSRFAMRPLPLDKEDVVELLELKTMIEQIRAPVSPVKRTEFLEQKELLKEVLQGLLRADLRTNCRFILPYPILSKPFAFRAVSQGLQVEGRFVTSYIDRPEFMLRAQKPMVMVPRIPTRWQFGLTQVEMTFLGLVDHSARVEALQLPMEPTPTDGWPSVFRVAFQVIYDLYWEMRGQEGYLGVWTPSASDLGDIEYWVSTRNNPSINFMRKGSPAIGFRGLVPTVFLQDTTDFGEITAPPLYWQCRILAVQYLEFGETREALFWINVGVESLLKHRMESLASEAGLRLDELDPGGTSSYWDDAKSLVAKQFPDVANAIEWPQKIPAPPSMFRRIKFFFKASSTPSGC